jgi:hypothetical protein
MTYIFVDLILNVRPCFVVDQMGQFFAAMQTLHKRDRLAELIQLDERIGLGQTCQYGVIQVSGLISCKPFVQIDDR